MNINKEEIKKLLEEDNSSLIEHADVDAFSRILTVLGKEDEAIPLPTNFSESIIKIVLKKRAREGRWGWFGYIAGIAGLVIALIVSLVLVDFKLDFGFLKGISSYSGLFLFGIAFIVILNFLEKWIIRFSSE